MGSNGAAMGLLTAGVDTKTRAVMRPAEASDIEPVSHFLATQMDRGLGNEVYRALFTYPWRPVDAPLGMVLESGGRIVGFIGCICADREIAGRTYRFCNLSNWCVLPQFRKQSLDILFPLLRQKDVTYTDLSPTVGIETLFTKMRFVRLNQYKWFTVPLMHAAGILRRAHVISRNDLIPEHLNATHLKIWRDHQGTACRHTVVIDGMQQCYVVSRRRKRKSLVFSEILYTSDAAVMRAHFERLKLSILRRDHTLLLACDEHIYGAHPRGFLRYSRPEYFRSPSLNPANIDHLYSETALL